MPKVSETKLAEIWRNAKTIGNEAGNGSTPTPMIVTGMGQRYFESEGMCGFAYVTISPARGPLVSYLKKNRIGHSRYGGGYEVSVSEHGQSVERKEKHAEAMAKYLESQSELAEYRIGSYSRLD
jgi:hypothetical protein